MLRRARCAGHRVQSVQRLDDRSSRSRFPPYPGLPADTECIPCELRASHGSTAAPLSSAASSSASLAVRLLQTHPIGLPHRSLLRLLRYPRPNCLAARGVDCLPAADGMTRQLSSLGSKLRCCMGEAESKMRNVRRRRPVCAFVPGPNAHRRRIVTCDDDDDD